ncbi:hypothetical protein IKN40_06880 [bacterium]|nr:hypothetical protein [bacterium]
MIYIAYIILGLIIVLLDWFLFVKKEVKGNGSIFLLPLCTLIWPIYLIGVIICRLFINKKSGTANLDKGFHPEIMYMINKPYAEYVDYKEIN